jgi:hypothetical protein
MAVCRSDTINAVHDRHLLSPRMTRLYVLANHLDRINLRHYSGHHRRSFFAQALVAKRQLLREL